MNAKLTTIDKYIFNQLVLFSIFGVSLFTILWVTPEILYKTVRNVILSDLSIWTGIQIILLNIPDILIKSIPIGLMVGALLTFDKLSRGSEYIAFRTLGMTVYRLAKPVFYAGVIGLLLILLINENVLPPAVQTLNILKNDVSTEGRYFTYIKKTETGTLQEIHVGSREGLSRKFKNITLLNFMPNAKTTFLNRIITAKEGFFNNTNNSWHLQNTVSYTITEDGIYSTIDKQDSLEIKAPIEIKELLEFYGKNPKELNTSETLNFINVLDQTGQGDDKRYMEVRLHQKFAQPFSCLIFAFTGMLLGAHFTRTVKFFGYTAGMTLIFVYYTLWPFASALGYIGVISPFISAWLPNFVVLLFCMLMFKKLNT